MREIKAGGSSRRTHQSLDLPHLLIFAVCSPITPAVIRHVHGCLVVPSAPLTPARPSKSCAGVAENESVPVSKWRSCRGVSWAQSAGE